MATQAHVWYMAVQKLIVLVSLAFGLLVIGVCTYTTIQVYQPDFHNGTNNVTGSQHTEEHTDYVLDHKNLANSLRKVVLICSALGIVAGFFQSMVSLCNLFSCSKNTGTNIKVWLAMHFLIFVTLLVCILLPFNFHKDTGEAHDISGMLNSVKANFNQVLALLNFENFLENMIHPYLIILVINEVIIFFLMVISCCCMRFGLYEYENLDDSFGSR